MKQIGKYLIIGCMALNIFSCNVGKKVKVKWRSGINAPVYYPCRVVSGKYTDGKNNCSIATGSYLYGGWGHGGLEMSTAEFIPNELSIKWFAFAENKFYGGTFSLPTDTMRNLFAQGCTSVTGFNSEYDYIVVNVYPKGGVALWLDSSGGRCVEIGHFQAKEVEYNWRSMFPNSAFSEKREEYNEFIMSHAEGATEYIAQHGITQEPFKTIYRRRYNYTIEIDRITHMETKVVCLKCYNGETDMISGEELENNFFKTKAVPKYISINWFENKILYFGRMYFDAKEIFDAFAEMNKDCSNEPYVLYFKHDYNRRFLSVSLRSQTKEIELKKTGRVGKSLRQPYQ